jgi:hypothetical protein
MFKTIRTIVNTILATPVTTPSPIVQDYEAFRKSLLQTADAILPKTLQSKTLEQWRLFIREIAKEVLKEEVKLVKAAAKPATPAAPVNQPQSVQYTLEGGVVVVVDGLVPPLSLIEGSVDAGFALFSDKLGNEKRVVVAKSTVEVTA